jgi:hypothetical protein
MSRRLLFSPYYAILVAFLRLGRVLWGRECMVGLVADARGDAGCYRPVTREDILTPSPRRFHKVPEVSDTDLLARGIRWGVR